MLEFALCYDYEIIHTFDTEEEAILAAQLVKMFAIYTGVEPRRITPEDDSAPCLYCVEAGDHVISVHHL